MKVSTKGMLLSGLVYPGLGQLILGRVAAGIVFMSLATAGLIVLIYGIVQRASHLIDRLLPLLAENKLDVRTLKEMLSRDSAGEWGLETISLIVIAGCWLAAIGHAYFVGKKIEKKSS
jgi:hypothetical protein